MAKKRNDSDAPEVAVETNEAEAAAPTEEVGAAVSNPEPQPAAANESSDDMVHGYFPKLVFGRVHKIPYKGQEHTIDFGHDGHVFGKRSLIKAIQDFAAKMP